MLPSPSELGFNPDKFPDWREQQPRVIEEGLESSKRFVAQVQKTGLGKSLTYMAQAVISKKKTMILTSSKGLQSQLLADFDPHPGIADIRGKANYSCSQDPTRTCEEGIPAKCLYRGNTLCAYTAARQNVMNSPISTTNYACWMSAQKYGVRLGNFDMLVMDEFHSSIGHLNGAMMVTISDHEVCHSLKSEWPKSSDREDMEAWKQWALVVRVRAESHLQSLKDKLDQTSKPSAQLLADYKHYDNLSKKLADLATCHPTKWIADEWLYGYRFDPIDSSEYAERLLFAGVEKIICVSATIRPRTFQMLGVEIDNLDFFEYESAINPSKSPMIHVPTMFVTKDSTDWEMRENLIPRIDEIIEGRFDRRGIIHTSSFRLRDFIINNSKYAKFMISNYSGNGEPTAEVIRRFKSIEPPVVLVSPSIGTGYDFPGQTCRYQIIAKLPYPNHFDAKVDIERTRTDPKRGPYQMMQSLTQMFGRGDRSELDWQEVFITDNCIEKAMWRYSDMAPSWLQVHYKKMDHVPQAPNLDEMRRLYGSI